MNKSVSAGLFLALLLMCMLTLSVRLQMVKAQPSTIIVPDDYPTIQEAINNANNGDTIFVRSGTYQQPGWAPDKPDIVINKSISLIGQDEETTVILDYPYGSNSSNNIIEIQADNVTIEGFTFQYGEEGCIVHGSGCSISDCKFINTDIGVDLDAENNTVSDCFFNANCDVVIYFSSNNTVTSNVFQGEGVAREEGTGIILFGGSGNRIVGNEINNFPCRGISLDFYSDYNIVAYNNITNNGWVAPANDYPCGIFLLDYADSNRIVDNNVSNNICGLLQRLSSSNNLIYHNSFVDNQVQVGDIDVYLGACVNLWNNGYPSGGNYWSDYNGTDLYSGPYQNVTGSDGIGDTPYVIDANNMDPYPLMDPYVSIAYVKADSWNVTVTAGPVPFDSTGMLSLESFTVSSRGQVSSLSYNATISELAFQVNMPTCGANVSGTNTNVTLPAGIVESSILVITVNVDGKANGFILFQPSTLGFYLSEGNHTVTLDIGVDPPAVPEFEGLTLALFLFVTLLVVSLMKRKRSQY